MDIGSAIRQMREQLGLKLEAVAMEAGTDAGNLSRIETGKQKPSIGRLESIARAMNVGVTDLYALIENVRVLPATPPPLRDGDDIPYTDDTHALRRSFAPLNAHHRKL
ncbi:helix-turn-helix transcriptional regulator, partial [Pigmentiphaga sp.]|uniref:helix-turn-helix domain-containing protein n=1 Tax=Pigmentiphaga sp. TaxID=1977564 RepID=UPI0025CEE687